MIVKAFKLRVAKLSSFLQEFKVSIRTLPFKCVPKSFKPQKECQLVATLTENVSNAKPHLFKGEGTEGCGSAMHGPLWRYAQVHLLTQSTVNYK